MSETTTDSKTQTKEKDKNADATATGNASTDSGTTPPKPHRKSNYVTLAEGQADNQTVFTSFAGSSALIPLILLHGKFLKIVDDSSNDANTVGRDWAEQMINKGLLMYADAPDKDAKMPVALPAPETPMGDMLANGVMVIGENGEPVFAEGAGIGGTFASGG